MYKSPAEMRNIELLEVYSEYTKHTFRLTQEQDYLFSLRQEILKRMAKSEKQDSEFIATDLRGDLAAAAENHPETEGE